MATSTIKLNETYQIKPGSNSIENIIAAGYNTGSGNYFNVFIPCNINTNAVITNITIDSSNSKVFTNNGVITLTGSSFSEAHAYPCGIAAEFKYASTKTINIPITAYLINVVITCS